MKNEETDWLKRLKGEETAREKALSELRSFLIAGLTRSLSGRAGGDAAFIEDVCQVAIVRIIKKLDTFKGRSRFTSWAMAIALRVAFNELRRKEWNNVSIEALMAAGEREFEDAESNPGPDESLERASLIAFIHETIANKLTSRQQLALFAELRGLPQEEIAKQLNTSRNNVYKLFHDARKALKRELERSGFGIEEARALFASSKGKAVR